MVALSACSSYVWEGPKELLLAKVKNASGRIGIFITKSYVSWNSYFIANVQI